MNARQRKFVDEYLKLGNIYQSAIRAGYSEAYAKTTAFRILNQTSVKEYLEQQQAKIDSKNIADAREIQEFLTSVLRGKQADLTTRDRLKAAELLGKTKAMFSEKRHVTATISEPVKIVDDVPAKELSDED